MIEVFKTNVTSEEHARVIVDAIRRTFVGHSANFDLEDSDKILRVKCEAAIQSDFLICFLNDLKCRAEILSDEPDAVSRDFLATNYLPEFKWEK